jgi:type III pantothenate kinase
MTALLLDIGNSRLKWGLLKDGTISRTGNFTHEKILEQGLAVIARKLPRGTDRAIACNVAGQKFATSLTGFIASHNGHELQFVRSQAKAFGVKNAYRQPSRLGVDRWVAMIGARASCDAACLIVDAGTALTIDALDANGRHLGGQILPGIMLMADALGRNTSDLPKSRRRISNRDGTAQVFARSTSAAIAQGAIGAAAGAVERALRVLRDKAGKPALLLTGGDATLLQQSLDEAAQLRPHLVLEGLSCYFEIDTCRTDWQR